MSAKPAKASAVQLIDNHLPIARQISARLKRRYTWVNMEDLYSYSLLGLTMAANAYDPTRGVPFPNFASQKAMFWAIDEMRKDSILKRRGAKKTPRMISMHDTNPDTDQGTFEIADEGAGEAKEKLEAKDLCSALLGQLRMQDRELLIMYYSQQLTFKEIAKVFSISESSVCLRHKALIQKLRKMAHTMNAA
jgi:RNA polymerase sigma factor (sigma-70 family)